MGFFDKFKKKKAASAPNQEASLGVADLPVKKAKTKEKKEETKTKKSTSQPAVAPSPPADKKTKIEKKEIKTKKTDNSKAYSVLIKPLVSEKAAEAESKGAYTFIVNKEANKFDIKQSVKEAYGIMPEKVRIINVEGKRVRFGSRHGKRSDWKKAIVKLPKGKTINIHEGV